MDRARFNIVCARWVWRRVPLFSEVLAEVSLRDLSRGFGVCTRYWFQRLEDGVVERRGAAQCVHREYLVRDVAAPDAPSDNVHASRDDPDILVETEVVHESMTLYVVRPEDLRRSHTCFVRGPRKARGTRRRRRGRREGEKDFKLTVLHRCDGSTQ